MSKGRDNGLSRVAYAEAQMWLIHCTPEEKEYVRILVERAQELALAGINSPEKFKECRDCGGATAAPEYKRCHDCHRKRKKRRRDAEQTEAESGFLGIAVTESIYI